MGDYLSNGAKIGTCGNAYYATKKQLERHAGDGDARYYLDPSKGCKFAFPFPQYDGKDVGEFSNFHSGERVDFFFDVPADMGTHHKEIVFHSHPKGAEGVNLYCDCPHKGGKVSHNFNPDKVTFRLVSQCYYEGHLHIAAECVYCECLNVFSKDEAEVVCEWIESRKHDTQEEKDYYMEIAKRIRETYE